MIFIILLLTVFLVDLLLKKYVEAKVKSGEKHLIAGGKILVRKLHNDGLAFGRLSEKPELIERGTAGLLGVLAVYFAWLLCQPGKKVKKTGISMVIGGGLCNWLDRFHQGFVTDYLSIPCQWKKLQSIVFNLSDICIFVGSFLYLVGSIFGKAGKTEGKR